MDSFERGEAQWDHPGLSGLRRSVPRRVLQKARRAFYRGTTGRGNLKMGEGRPDADGQRVDGKLHGAGACQWDAVHGAARAWVGLGQGSCCAGGSSGGA